MPGYVVSNAIADTNIVQVGQFTANLAQAAATYTLCTATGGDILITNFSFYVQTAGSVFTSVQIKTNQTNSTDLMSAAEGVVANILAQKLVSVARTAPIFLKSGQLLQYVIVGATGSGSLTCNFTYQPFTVGARLI